MRESPDFELLLLCARPQMNAAAAERLRALLAQELDWALIFQLSEDYRTTPQLALQLHRHAEDLLPDAVLAELQNHHRESTRHNLVLAAEVLRLVALFANQGIDVIPFKGPVSAMLAYGDLARRACGDIDLLVKQTDHDKAEELLQGAGYKVVQRYDNAMQSGLWHEQRQTSVDLHWGVAPDTLTLNADLLWQDLQAVNLLGQPVPTFSPRDSMLIMATNAVKEYWKPSLHQLTDIAALTERYTDADWQAAFSRARDIGCLRILCVALLFTHRLLDTPLPAAGPAHLFRHKRINRAVDELADHLFIQVDIGNGVESMQMTRHRMAPAYYLTLTDSAWQRLRDWLEWAGAPNRADQDFIKLPRKLAFLYLFIRPLRLLMKRL